MATTASPAFTVTIAAASTVTSIFATTGGTLASPFGTWSFGTATSSGGNALLLNGAQAGGGFGAELHLISGQVYTFTKDLKWYQWANGWNRLASAPAGAPHP